MLYVGVDAHKNTSHITVVDTAGKILRRKEVPSTPAGVRDAFDERCANSSTSVMHTKS